MIPMMLGHFRKRVRHAILQSIFEPGKSLDLQINIVLREQPPHSGKYPRLTSFHVDFDEQDRVFDVQQFVKSDLRCSLAVPGLSRTAALMRLM